MCRVCGAFTHARRNPYKKDPSAVSPCGGNGVQDRGTRLPYKVDSAGQLGEQVLLLVTTDIIDGKWNCIVRCVLKNFKLSDKRLCYYITL